jgi:hypothetical protein
MHDEGLSRRKRRKILYYEDAVARTRDYMKLSLSTFMDG